MADVNITYKGASIATMDASGTKTLETSGKYCEDDIAVVYTDPEKPTQTKSVTPSESAQTVTADAGYELEQVNVGAIPPNYVGSGVTQKAAQTYTPTTTDQTIAAGQYLEGAQIVKGDANLIAANIKDGVSIFGVTGTHSGGTTPSGSVTITENGTYDVTDKASAVVALPYVYKRWVYTNSAEKSTAENVVLISDQWLAQNYDNANLEVEVSAIDSPNATDTDKIYFIHDIVRNKSFTSGTDYYQVTTRIGNSRTYPTVLTNILQGTHDPTSRGQVRLKQSGELKLRVDSNCILAAGNYEIIARIIP